MNADNKMCVTSLPSKEVKFTWKVELDALRVLSTLDSDTFTSNDNIVWFLRFDSSFIDDRTLHLCLQRPAVVQAKYKFELQKKDGSYISYCVEDFETFRRGESDEGWDDLDSNVFENCNIDGYLVITCTVRVFKKPIKNGVASSEPVEPKMPNLATSFDILLENEIFTDVEFVVQDAEFKHIEQYWLLDATILIQCSTAPQRV